METFLVSAPDTKGFVALGASTAAKRLFRKQILPMNGSFVHPNDKSVSIKVDKTFAETLVKNFRDGICDTVQFPIVDDKNRHTEDPSKNLGQVVDLSYDDTGVYATIDVRKNQDEVGSTILGASAMMHLNYEDTKTGAKVGPTLLHVAATNRPYLTKLMPYEEIALSHTDADTTHEVVLLTPSEGSEISMTKDELLKQLKDEHGIDVVALQQSAGAADGNNAIVTALSNVLKAANTDDFVALSASDEEEPTLEDVAQGVVALSRRTVEQADQIVELSEKVEKFNTAQAESEVDNAVKEGKILPAQRDAYLELRLSNEEMFQKLLPEVAIVSLSEDGVTTHEGTPNSELDNAAAVVNRYVEKAKSV